MADVVDISRVSFIVMREMRKPILALIAVYSVSILGMVFIPGQEVDGKTQYMSIFHAFYFMTYTATTTGFGEIPVPFSDAQRFWAIACLYVSVVTWFYAIGSIIHLMQNPFFIRALAEWRFSRQVRKIPGPFYIICGFGDTGSVLTRGLSDYGKSAVIIDIDEERIKALQLRNYTVAMPGLCADAGVPKHLLEAGVRSRNCKAVVAITNNEETNLKISALARSLNKNVGVITMSKVDVFEETLVTLGGEVHIVDPFKTYAKVLAAAMHNPGFYALNNWLVRERGAQLDKYIKPPRGRWIICGFGRMGHEVNRVLTKYNMTTSIIDPDPKATTRNEYIEHYIIGRTTAKTLSQAGIEDAVGIIAATDDDGHNLGILLNARFFNKKLFTIARQNRHHNAVAFNASNVDMIMQPSLVTARKILFLLIAPLLKKFFGYLLANKPGRETEMKQVIRLLRERIGHRNPHLITIHINEDKSSALVQRLREGKSVCLGDLQRDPRNREKRLDLLVFVIKQGNTEYILPQDDFQVKEGDQILYCSTLVAHQLFYATLNNEYKLYYIMEGEFLPHSALIRWWLERKGRKGLRPGEIGF